MFIQRFGVGRLGSGAPLALALLLSVWGCSSSSEGAATPSDAGAGGAEAIPDGGEPASGGTSSAGEAAVGGAEGGGGAVATTECPLDALARARTEAIVIQAINEADWIVNQTHGVGQFAGRGFGFAIPLTTVASILSITLMDECTGPQMFEEYCPPPEASGSESSPCSQLECLGPGELGTTVHYDPVPFTAPLEPPPGDVSVVSASQSSVFTDQEDESVAVEWTTELQLVPEGETQLTITQSGTATAGTATAVPAIGTVAVDGLVVDGGALQVDYSVTAEEVTGTGTFDGQDVLTVTHDGVVWSGPCAP